MNASILLRRLLTRRYGDAGAEIPIRTIVEDRELGETLEKCGLKNHKDADYGITLLGSPQKIFSYDVIVHSELTQTAEDAHMSWVKKNNGQAGMADPGKEEEERNKFYLYDYFYRSSEAQVIRNRVRDTMKVEETLKQKGRSDGSPEKDAGDFEHMAWNAYMRSEGYIYDPRRDDIAKTHYDLVSCDELDKAEKSKDY